MQHNLYVQYGCGLCAPPSWTNFDASPTLRMQRVPLMGRAMPLVGPKFPAGVRYGDIIKGLPLAPGACDAIFCSHVLEHLSLHDLRTALANTYTYLKPGGIFRCVLPDLEYLAREYLGSAAEQPSVRFMEESLLGWPRRPRGLSGVLREWLGNSRHLWMWDYRSLAKELGTAGFVEIRRAKFGDAADPHFRDVEDPGRWENCLGIECRKGPVEPLGRGHA